jgi:RND family efflux transporter MFP subunit
MSDSSGPSPWIKLALVVGILIAAVGIAAAFIATKEEPDKKPRANRGILVRVEKVAAQERQLQVTAQGNVVAARQIVVQPQVTGAVVSVSDKLVPGGRVAKGDVLVRIDPTDYRLAVAEAETSVKQAEAQLALEEGQQRVAKKEWELFKDDFEGKPQDDAALALRQPQLESAKVSVEAARARLERAKVNLRRTTIRAPFNAVVLTDNVDVGQFVSQQSQMATLADTDAAWIRVSVPIGELSEIAIPGVNAQEGEGSRVTIALDAGKGEQTWTGEVIRLLGELDPQGRMARVLVEVPDPLQLEDDGGFPLLLGSYVDVTFGARGKAKLVEIPREGLRDGDSVFLFDDGKLEIREVDIAWRRPRTVLVSSGLDDGDLLIVSQIAAPVEGMKVRLGDDDESRETAARGDDKSGQQSGEQSREQSDEQSDEPELKALNTGAAND